MGLIALTLAVIICFMPLGMIALFKFFKSTTTFSYGQESKARPIRFNIWGGRQDSQRKKQENKKVENVEFKEPVFEVYQNYHTDHLFI